MLAKTADGARHDHGSTPAGAVALDAVLHAIGAMLERTRWAVWRWYQARRTERQLSGLPDHMLKDIGLSRSTLLSATLRRVREEEAARRGACW